MSSNPLSSQRTPALLGQRAIILGASIAGLLAARILSERFAEVWLLERDELPEGPAPRRGTPHAVHPHGLLARGLEVLEELFPGFADAMRACGAPTGDLLRRGRFYVNGRHFAVGDGNVVGLGASRLALEAEVRRRVRMLAQVNFVTGVDVIEPVLDEARARVVGVRMASRTSGNSEQCLAADLVMDCTGRGSRTPQWLRGWGFDAPEEERVTINIGYTTAYFYRPPEQDEHEVGAVTSTATAEQPRGAVLVSQEPEAAPDGQPGSAAEGSGRWVVGVGGYAGDNTECTLQGLRERARQIGVPEIIRITHEAEPIGPVTRYGFPFSQRRRYDKLKRFPANYLLMGDALTSFNPIYGQGMTTAACEALALRQALHGGLANVHKRFLKAASKIIDTPWQLAVGADLALPMVPGRRSPAIRLVNAYVARLRRVAYDDAAVALAFLRVVHMQAPPASLFGPGVLWKVLRGPRPASVREATRAERSESIGSA